MTWWNEFAERVERDVALAPLTWFGLGGAAAYVFHPRDAEDLAGFVRLAADESLPYRVLGEGANVLVRDNGVDGVVVRLDRPAFRRVERRGQSVVAGGGAGLMPLVKYCTDEGLSGLETLAGIPATVGGAARMNAGGRFGEFGSFVREVTVLDRKGELRTFSNEACGFRYRGSNLGDYMVIDATLDLTPEEPESVRRRYDEVFEFKRSTQPIAERSAGCIFKNPRGQSAGALIDRAGLKGTRRGGAMVSPRHANFIVTERGARSSDVLHLIDHVRDRVMHEFSTELEVEVDIW